MKIAIDAHSLGTQAGGNESYFRQLLHGLAAQQTGDHYTVFHLPGSAPAHLEQDQRFTLVPIPSNPLARLGFSLPRRLSQLQPDVFHCQYIRPLSVKAKTVVSIHDLAYEHFPDFFHPAERLRLKTLVRWTARRADHILTLSEFSANDIAQRYGVPRERITVTYLAADEEFRPCDKQACRATLASKYKIDSPFILYVGRIQARKNLPRLLEAYARLRDQGAQAKLVLVGKKDWQAEKLTAKLRELKLEGSVIFPGYVAQEDIPLFYNAAEVFVFPSFFEGFGLPVIESMASGTPTITSYGSSLEEIAAGAALLIDPADTASLTDALGKVLQDTELRSRLVSQGLQRSAQFKHSLLAEKVLTVYRSLLA